MASTVKFLGKFSYQADFIRAGRRMKNPQRLNVIGTTEYEIPGISSKDLVTDAAVLKLYGENGRHRFAGWNGGLWTPLSDDLEHFYPTLKPNISLERYLGTFTDWSKNGYAIRMTDPLRRAHARLVGPSSHGLPDPAPAKTLDEIDIVGGTVKWSNYATALQRHHAEARNLLVVDGMMYVRQQDPVFLTSRSPADLSDILLTVPRFHYTSDDEVYVKDHKFNASLRGRHAFRADRMAEACAMAGNPKVAGDVIRLDPEFLSRDDVGHQLFCELPFFIENAKRFTDQLSDTAAAGLKSMINAFRRSIFFDVTPISDAKWEILNSLALIKGELGDLECPLKQTTWKDALSGEIGLTLQRFEAERGMKAPSSQTLMAEDQNALAGMSASCIG